MPVTTANLCKITEDSTLGEINLIKFYYVKFEMNLSGCLLVEEEIILFCSGSSKLCVQGK